MKKSFIQSIKIPRSAFAFMNEEKIAVRETELMGKDLMKVINRKKYKGGIPS